MQKSQDSQKSKYSQLWTKHRPEGMSEEDFIKHLNAAKPVFEALAKILSEQVAEREAVTEPDYTCPSWSHKQAHRNGFVSCAESIKKMIS